MTHSQKKRPDVKEILCCAKMLDMKDDFEHPEKLDENLLKTIKFPQNIKTLNENLPRAKYESKSKTSKMIPAEAVEIKTIKSSAKLPLPSLRIVISEKNLILPQA